jgi:hypothetical protein
MNSQQVHRQLVQELTTIGLPVSKPLGENIAYLCQALAVSANCHLATLALGVPLPGQREQVVQRLRRLLKQDRLDPAECYLPVVGHLLAHWRGREINLVMDRTDLENRQSILLLGAAYHQRVLPLTWALLPHGGTDAERQIQLLQRVQPYLPTDGIRRVHFFGDTEFRAVALQRQAQDYRWHWQVGLKSDLLFHAGDERWRPLGEIPLQRGERAYLPGVTLTREHAFGPVNLIADWAVNQDHPRYWSLDQVADKEAWRRGRKRYWIESTFRDWKSYGFDLENSHIKDPDRLEVLLLGMALTTVWLIHVGDWLCGHGRRHLLEPPHQDDYSLFRLGRDHLQRWRTLGGKVPIGWTVSHAF